MRYVQLNGQPIEQMHCLPDTKPQRQGPIYVPPTRGSTDDQCIQIKENGMWRIRQLGALIMGDVSLS